MTDSQAPERIWRVRPWHPMHFEYGLASWPVQEHAGEGSTCYIREDLHQAALDRIREEGRIAGLREAADKAGVFLTDELTAKSSVGPMLHARDATIARDTKAAILALIDPKDQRNDKA